MNKTISLALIAASLATAAAAAVAVAIAASGQDWSKPVPGDPPFFGEDANGDPIFPTLDETPLTTCRTFIRVGSHATSWGMYRHCAVKECCTTSCRTGPNRERVCSTSCNYETQHCWLTPPAVN